MSTWRKVLLGIFLVLLALVLRVSLYLPMSVKVVDAQTGEPIEGAVLLAQWTITRGFGFSSSYNHKVVEALSSENGKIWVPGVFKLFVNKPKLVVYKKGYVAWRHDRTFVDYKRKADFKWRYGDVIALEGYDEKANYTHREHISFISGGYSSGVPYGIFKKAWEWEGDRKYLRKKQ